MTATLREIVDDALSIVGEVAGAGVQTYSDDRMFADAIRSFNMIFKKYNWREYCTWRKLTLDGVTGMVTTNDLSFVLDFDDFIEVRRDGTNAKISVMPRDVNPYAPVLLAGSTPRYWTSLSATFDGANFANKRIKFLPITSTGLVNVFAKYYPVVDEAFDWTDTLYLDRDMLAYGTAYMTLAGDDMNPGAADMCKALMEDKYKTIMGNLSSHEILVGSSVGGIPQQWTDQWGSMS